MGRLSNPAVMIVLIAIAGALLAINPVSAQERAGLAATLEVLEPGVEVLRVETSNWIAVNLESIVGTGDTIRTNDTGRARVTYFSDGTSTQLLPNTEYHIRQFAGNDASFTLVLELVIGQTIQTLGRVLDPASDYQMMTPAMTLSARGTAFAVRVEDSGRAGMLVSDGLVDANADGESADVPPAYGIRADVDSDLSPVVLARTFEELDAALDGCVGNVTMLDDVSYNVRAGPATDSAIIDMLPAADIERFFGITQSSGWYQVEIGEQRGWIRAAAVTINENCPGLRVFSDDGSELPPPAAASRQISVNAV